VVVHLRLKEPSDYVVTQQDINYILSKANERTEFNKIKNMKIYLYFDYIVLCISNYRFHRTMCQKKYLMQLVCT
jgi:hypothetical protein